MTAIKQNRTSKEHERKKNGYRKGKQDLYDKWKEILKYLEFKKYAVKNNGCFHCNKSKDC